MSYYKSYMKYKIKYKALRDTLTNQIGGIDCNSNYGFFNNCTGTCWIVVVLMIFIINNEKAQEKLRTRKYTINGKYKKYLPLFLYKNSLTNPNVDEWELHDEIIVAIAKFFEKLRTRIAHKEQQEHVSPLPFKRTIERMDSIDPSLEEDLDILVKNIFFKKQTIIKGGTLISRFFLILLVSIFLCDTTYTQDFISNTNLLNMKKHINININLITGATIYSNNHIICFYKCKEEYKLCDNDKIISYDWSLFFNILNWCNKKTFTYKLYCQIKNTYNEPIIFYTDKRDGINYIMSFNGSFFVRSISKDISSYIEIEDIRLYYENTSVDSESYINKYESMYLILYIYYKEYSYLDNFTTQSVINRINTYSKSGYIDIILFLLEYPRLNISKEDKIKYIDETKYNANISVNKALDSYDIHAIEGLIQNGFDINSTENSYLQDACITQNTNRVLLLLKLPTIDVAVPNIYGITPLSSAIYSNNLEIAIPLISKYYDIYMPIYKNLNMLMLACKVNFTELVRYLVEEKKYDINIVNSDGDSALLFAMKKTSIDIINIFISHKQDSIIFSDCFIKTNFSANINLIDSKGKTMLIGACRWENEDIVKFLLEQPSIDVNITCKIIIEVSAVEIAILLEKINIIKLFIEKFGIDYKYNNGTLLTIAKKYNKLTIIDFLM